MGRAGTTEGRNRRLAGAVTVLAAVALTLVPVVPSTASSHAGLPVPFKVADIVPGTGGSFPRDLTALGKGVVFTAVGPDVGRELYFSDGTPDGTVLLADLRPGTTSSNPQELTAVPALGKVFFRAQTDEHGTELFATDGTPNGTQLVLDVIPGELGSFPQSLAAGAGLLYFFGPDAAGDGKVWSSDGTAAGTRVLEGIPAGAEVFLAQEITEVGGRVYFIARTAANGPPRLHRSGDGTLAVIDLPGDPSSGPKNLTNLHDQLLVLTADVGGGLGRQLVTVDPASGDVDTVVVNPDESAFPPSVATDGPLTVVNPLLLLADTAAGVQLVESDGTQGGTRTVSGGGSGLGTSFSGPVIPLDGGLRVAARSADNVEVIDRGSGQITNVTPGEAFSETLPTADPNGGLVFFASIAGTGHRALYHSDGQSEAQELGRFADVSSVPTNEPPVVRADDPGSGNATLFFTASTAGDAGAELWAVVIEADRQVPLPSHDLELVKTGSPSPVDILGTLTYTLVVTNRGDAIASNVVLRDSLGLGHRSASADVPCSITPGADGTEVVCNLGDLTPGQSVTVTITSGISVIDVGRELRNVALARADGVETTDVFANDDEVVTPILTADLDVMTTATPNAARFGDDLGYTAWVANNGPGTAHDVELTSWLGVGHDVGELPEGCSTEGSPAAGATVRCEVGDLAPGENRWVPIPTSIEGDADGDGSITAEDLSLFQTSNQGAGFPGGEVPDGNDVDGDGDVDENDLAVLSTTTAASNTPEPEPDPSPNTSQTTTRVLPPDGEPTTPIADLSVTKTASHTGPIGSPVEVGDTITYTITVTNEGPDTAVDTVLVDPLGPGLRFAGTPHTDCGQEGGGVECRLGDIPNGASRTRTIMVAVDAADVAAQGIRVLSNTVTVGAATEAGPSANTATVDVPVSTADLQVTKTGSAEAGLAVYTVTVRNHGPGTARNVRFVDTPGPGHVIEPALVPLCSVGGTTTVTCALGDIEAGGAVTRTVSLGLDDGSAPGTALTNVVVAASDTPEQIADRHSNRDEVTVRVSQPPVQQLPPDLLPAAPVGGALRSDVTRTVAAGDTVRSADGAPRPGQPLVTEVTPSTDGAVRITTLGGNHPSPIAATLLPIAADISAPRGIDPLTLLFRIHASLLGDAGLGDVIPFRNGVPVTGCPSGAPAAPLPCYTKARGADGSIDITVLTPEASLWTFGLPLDITQDITGACPPGRQPAARFDDLGSAVVHAPAIACLAALNVARGVGDLAFAPGRAVTRAQLASFIDRLLNAAGVALPTGPDAFDDDTGLVHEAAINRLAAAGVVRGTAGRSYHPDRPATRGEVATVLARAFEAAAGEPLPAGPDRFGDDGGVVHEANIDTIAAAGIAAGVTATDFRPAASVTRGQMATFLARLLARLVADGMVDAPAAAVRASAPPRVR